MYRSNRVRAMARKSKIDGGETRRKWIETLVNDLAAGELLASQVPRVFASLTAYRYL